MECRCSLVVKHRFRKARSDSSILSTGSEKFMKKKLGFKVSENLWKEIIKYYEETYTGVIPSTFSMEEFALQRLESAKEQLDKLKLRFPNLPKEAICLDAGCGLGGLLVLANLAGFNFLGFDLDIKALNIARKLLTENGLSKNKVSNSPKFKRKFDLITSFEVVEHVTDTNLYLKSLRRIISPSGILFIETPNYLIPYEPHFYVFLSPGPKKVKWLIWKLCGGKNEMFFNELNFVTSFGLSKALKDNMFRIEDLGKKAWLEEILGNPSVQRSQYVQKIAKIIRTFRLSWLIKFGVNLGIFTPQIYLCYPK